MIKNYKKVSFLNKKNEIKLFQIKVFLDIMSKTLKQKSRSRSSRKPSRSGRKIPNAWILFSNEFYNKYYKHEKVKRTLAMKVAKHVWSSMSVQEQAPYYYRSEKLKKSRLNCNTQSTCNEIIFVLENENGNDQYEKLFDEVMNPEMFQDWISP